MNGETMRQVARSVQLAVMTAPKTTILEAAVEARRRHGTVSDGNRMPAASAQRSVAAAGA